uniref:Uncharacterized protein n=1 Tax=Cacopsylla melanoneura TaxID=428564 RepID=A0A8D8ZB30_9HEMI
MLILDTSPKSSLFVMPSQHFYCFPYIPCIIFLLTPDVGCFLLLSSLRSPLLLFPFSCVLLFSPKCLPLYTTQRYNSTKFAVRVLRFLICISSFEPELEERRGGEGEEGEVGGGGRRRKKG